MCSVVCGSVMWYGMMWCGVDGVSRVWCDVVRCYLTSTAYLRGSLIGIQPSRNSIFFKREGKEITKKKRDGVGGGALIVKIFFLGWDYFEWGWEIFGGVWEFIFFFWGGGWEFFLEGEKLLFFQMLKGFLRGLKLFPVSWVSCQGVFSRGWEVNFLG